MRNREYSLEEPSFQPRREAAVLEMQWPTLSHCIMHGACLEFTSVPQGLKNGHFPFPPHSFYSNSAKYLPRIFHFHTPEMGTKIPPSRNAGYALAAPFAPRNS